MRIALVYDALVPWVNGGAERRFAELARALSADHEVTHISWQWWDGPARMERDGIAHLGVGTPPRFYGEDGKRTIREAAAFAARVVPALLRNEWDVVDCSATPYLPLYTAWAATRITRTPLVATWHECWGRHWAEYLPDRPVVARLAQALEAGARPLADRIVAVSPFTLRRMGREPSIRHRVVGNGVDRAEFASSAGDAVGGIDRDIDVISIGRLIDEKRVDLVIDALASLKVSGRHISAVVAGDGPARADLERRARDRGVAAAIEFVGSVDDVTRRDLLRRSRLAVLASQREGFGIGVLEAQAAGVVPIVASGPHTAAPDLVDDGVDGIVVAPDAAAIAVAIERLIRDDVPLAAIRSAALTSAEGRDWRTVAEAMTEIYAELVAPRAAVAAVG